MVVEDGPVYGSQATVISQLEYSRPAITERGGEGRGGEIEGEGEDGGREEGYKRQGVCLMRWNNVLACVCACIRACMHACVCVCVHAHIQVCVCMCVCEWLTLV